MKIKYVIPLVILAFWQSCSPDFPATQEEEPVVFDPNDISTLVVPNNHDLRPLTLQNTNVNLSEESRAEMVKVKIFKVENDIYKLLYEGFIDKNKSISNTIKVPNHTKLLSVQADLAVGTREWLVTPNELQNIKIEDEERDTTDEDKSSNYDKTSSKAAVASDPPTWDCADYAEFNGADDGDFTISNASTQGLDVQKNTKIYICSGGSWNPAYVNGSTDKLTIYVGENASLTLSGNIASTIFNVGTFNGINLYMAQKAKFDNWGVTNISGNLNMESNDINIYGGTCNISGSVDISSAGHLDIDGGQLNVGGHLRTSGKLHNKSNSEISVAGDFTVNDGEFMNDCKAVISGNLLNNKKVEFKNASYTVVAGSFISNSSNDIKLQEGSIFKSASIMSNGKIKGHKAYSIIETGSITFNGNVNFQGELDICSDNYTDNMGDKDVINTCETFISAGTCSPGYNNVADNDSDGVIAGVDVDDENPEISSYNYPQGQNNFFTSVYEDLYPCMGDYDLNDLVHYYTYREGVAQSNNNGNNSLVTEIKFDYKFPAIGAGFNNSLVLRVVDEDNNASLSLDVSDRYPSNNIERLHDDQNGTTLFIFKNIKSIYTANELAIINTVRLDYQDIPLISGSVTNINGAYDEFMLKDGVLGQEIHPVYNKFHNNYPALNLPTMYNDSSNFSRCDDSSSGNSLFVNKNKFPWVLNDIPIDFPWPKEGITILKAYPNFNKFVKSNYSLDWYSNINGNRDSSNIIQ